MYERNNKLTELLYCVIAEHDELEDLNDLMIVALTSSSAKKSHNMVTYAECTKVTDKMKALTGTDFVITFYLPNLTGISTNALKALCWHELKHIGWNGEKKWIIPHDLSDFKEIVDLYGTDWIKME